MVKNFQDVGDEILDEVLVYIEERGKFEKLLAQAKVNVMSDEYNELVYMLDSKAWEALRSRIYEKLRNIGV